MIDPPSPPGHLAEAIHALVRSSGLDGAVRWEQSPSGYTTWDRRHGPTRRHLWVRPLEGEFAGQYGLVWGEYPAWEDHPDGIPGFFGFDARSLGPPEFVIAFFRRWMIDWSDRRSVPRAPGG